MPDADSPIPALTGAATTPAKAGRLSRSADFDRVYRSGRSVQRRHMVMYVFERPDGDDAPREAGCRLGLTVSRKVGGATDRNRIKRQLREAATEANMDLPGHDVVLIARPGLVESVDTQGFPWLVEELTGLVAEARDRLARRKPR